MNKINKYQTKSRIMYCIEKVSIKQAQLMKQPSEQDPKTLSCNESNPQNLYMDIAAQLLARGEQTEAVHKIFSFSFSFIWEHQGMPSHKKAQKEIQKKPGKSESCADRGRGHLEHCWAKNIEMTPEHNQTTQL